MKIKEGFVIKSLAGGYVVVTVGDAAKEFNGLIRMNETGAFLWNSILEGADTKEKLITAMLARYEDLDKATAKEDLEEFLNTVSFAIK